MQRMLSSDQELFSLHPVRSAYLLIFLDEAGTAAGLTSI